MKVLRLNSAVMGTCWEILEGIRSKLECFLVDILLDNSLNINQKNITEGCHLLVVNMFENDTYLKLAVVGIC